MQIYGRTPAEVYKLLAWQHKLIIFVAIPFLLFALIYVPYSVHHVTKSDELGAVLISLSHNGVKLNALEPSIATKDGIETLMVFTAIEAMDDNSVRTGIRAARADRGCKFLSPISGFLYQPKQDDLMKSDGVSTLASGHWHTETPSIVYDGGDKGREWKVFAYRYFWAGDRNLARLYSMIVMRSATNVFEEWSEERWIFSANPSSPPAPYGRLVEHHLSRLHPSLANVTYYARPSVIVTKGILLMSLSAFTAEKTSVDRVILLASTDHGKSWRYLGAPLTSADAARNGYTQLAGATLLLQDGAALMAAVYGNDKHEGAGTVIHRFESVPQAKLARDAATGAPIVAAMHPLPSLQPAKTGGGFAAYDDSCENSGMIVSVLSDITKKFELFKLMKKPLEQ
jgi:hypothetical protein